MIEENQKKNEISLKHIEWNIGGERGMCSFNNNQKDVTYDERMNKPFSISHYVCNIYKMLTVT